jgi:uncharacterized membrane protein
MLNQVNDIDRERGGIELRDYTRGDRPPALRRDFSLDRLRDNLEMMNFDKTARKLGWFSLGLGLVELLWPKGIQRLVGARGDYSGLIRVAGMREIVHALLIFTQARPNQGMWSRVMGDALDLVCLGAALTSPRHDQKRAAIATAAVAGITAVDALTAVQVSRKRAEERQLSVVRREDLNARTRGGAFHVTKCITVNRPAEELYAFWRNFENLPQFMYHLEEVQVHDDQRSRWAAAAPAGMRVEWEAEITDDRPNELIAWQSLRDADVHNSGSVRFQPAPGGRGTEVCVEIEYRPPGGTIGRAIARLFGEEPGQQVAGDLKRFKQVMETGEVLRSEGSPLGFGQKLQRPAQPSKSRNGDWMERELREQATVHQG